MPSVKTDRLLRVCLGLLVVAFVYVIYAAIHERVVVAGDSAPEFTIKADNGRSVSVPDFGGKLLVLNFWASWCPPCVEETPSLSRFAQEYASKGVVVLGISVDRDEKAYRAFLQKFNPAFLTVRELKIHEDYGTFMYPETYFIDAKGRVLKKIAEGVADWMDPGVRQIVDSML
ncbi:MAG TPA: TlpA disulfide reductase family protein [Bryobacteraceae bacterium]|nr:TlpA disulfide reductase family protein [Bryobacteraceae bacterium]